MGPVKTTLMLTFEAVAANLRLARQWARFHGDSSDPFNAAFAGDHGFEELDADGSIRRVEPDAYRGPPG